MNFICCRDMSHNATKPVFGISYKVGFKPQLQRFPRIIEISLIASLDMILYKKQIIKALIRLCGCAGWSVTLLFANCEDRFSCVEAHIVFLTPKYILIFLQVNGSSVEDRLRQLFNNSSHGHNNSNSTSNSKQVWFMI